MKQGDSFCFSVFNIPSTGSEGLSHLHNAVQKWVGRRFKFRALRTNGIVRYYKFTLKENPNFIKRKRKLNKLRSKLRTCFYTFF